MVVCWAAGAGAGEGFLLRFGRVVLWVVRFCFILKGLENLGVGGG